MTAQTTEELRHNGQDYSLLTLPLDTYLSLCKTRPSFRLLDTANRRGYVGSWEIQNDRLYLVELRGALKNGAQATLETFFPGREGPIFASWFSGTLRMGQGGIVDYFHGGFISRYAMESFLDIEDGVVVHKQVRVNRPPSRIWRRWRRWWRS